MSTLSHSIVPNLFFYLDVRQKSILTEVDVDSLLLDMTCSLHAYSTKFLREFADLSVTIIGES